MRVRLCARACAVRVWALRNATSGCVAVGALTAGACAQRVRAIVRKQAGAWFAVS
jgi:hypothetical protein